MLGVYASAAVILLASLVLGTALLRIVGLSAHTWLSGVVGFAALVIACPLLIRLPGRATTLAILLGIALIAGCSTCGGRTAVPGTRGALVGGRGQAPRRRRRARPASAVPRQPASSESPRSWS